MWLVAAVLDCMGQPWLYDRMTGRAVKKTDVWLPAHMPVRLALRNLGTWAFKNSCEIQMPGQGSGQLPPMSGLQGWSSLALSRINLES